LPSEANLSPRAAERVCRESGQKTFDEAAKSLNVDWQTTLDGKQLQRWSEGLGRAMVVRRDRQSQAYREGHYPQGPANAPQLLVIGMDGGRWQGREKDADGDSRWREDKVLTVSSYVPGNGGDRKPQALVRTQVATRRDAGAFGTMARVEAERRGYRQAQTVIAIGDGGNWIDPLLEREFRVRQRVIDWYHASEHLWDCAKAIHGPQTPAAAALARAAGGLAVGREGRAGDRVALGARRAARGRAAGDGPAAASASRAEPERRLLHPPPGAHGLPDVSRQRLADRLGRDRGGRQAVQQAGEGHRAVLDRGGHRADPVPASHMAQRGRAVASLLAKSACLRQMRTA